MFIEHIKTYEKLQSFSNNAHDDSSESKIEYKAILLNIFYIEHFRSVSDVFAEIICIAATRNDSRTGFR